MKLFEIITTRRAGMVSGDFIVSGNFIKTWSESSMRIMMLRNAAAK